MTVQGLSGQRTTRPRCSECYRRLPVDVDEAAHRLSGSCRAHPPPAYNPEVRRPSIGAKFPGDYPLDGDR